MVFFFLQESNFDNGVVQLIYEKLAVKRYRGIPLRTFWDKKCLSYGQNWEQGFLQGLNTSQVIILLMSNEVCLLYIKSYLFAFSNYFFVLQAMVNIVSNASSQQDNVLLEYHNSFFNFYLFLILFFELLKIRMRTHSKQNRKNTSCSSIPRRIWSKWLL